MVAVEQREAGARNRRRQGYSAIWIGLGLRETGGRLTTIEYDAARATTAADNIRRAGLADIVTVVSGDAFKEIPKLAGDVRLRVSRRLETRLQAILRPGVAAADAARPLPRPQRRQQADRDARFPCGDSNAIPRSSPPIVRRRHRRHVGSVKRIVDDSRSTSSACPSISAATAAAWTWGRRRFGLPASAIASRALGVPVVDQGDLPTPIPETQDRRDERKKFIRDIAQVCEQLYESALRLARRRARCRSCSAAITASPPDPSARRPSGRGRRRSCRSACSGSTRTAT